MTRRQENCAISCRVLLTELSRSKDNDERNLLLDDLLWKSRHLQPDLGWYFRAQALRYFVPKDISRKLEREEREEPKMKTRNADVVVVTVKQPELLSAKVAFDIDLEKEEDEYANGLRFWESVLSTREGRMLNVALTMIGEAGTGPCAAACDRLFTTYNVNLCVLIGIAAGLKGKVALGDVVAAEIILDYEHARLEPDGPKKRPRQFSPTVALGRDVEYFDPKIHGWHKEFFRCLETLKGNPNIQLPNLGNDWKPKYVSGVVLSGDKLIADGKMDEKRKEYHDRIVAAEMEAAGFARLCEEHEVPWSVFRGISDYGTPSKNDLWQVVSGLSVATAARLFLEKGYKKPDMKL